MAQSPPAQAPICFDRVAIIGVGLLGASLGLALKQRGLAKAVVGVGRIGSNSLATARQLGAIDDVSVDPVEGTRGADLLVVCTPVRQFPAIFKALARTLVPGAIITDVGSTKVQIMKWAEELLPAGSFVGSHPMAGSEKRGPEFARADLYENALCLLCGQGLAVERIDILWQALGMKTLRLSPEEHDRWVAVISHLPRIVSSALMLAAARTPEALEAVAGGFIDTTRIAAGDEEMWTDILLTNRLPIIEAIGEMQEELSALKKALIYVDEPAIRKHLAGAKRLRDNLLAKRKGC